MNTMHTLQTNLPVLHHPDSVPLIKEYRQRNFNSTFLFFFFQFSLETQSPHLPSTEDTSSVVKGGDRKGDTPIPHQSLLYWVQDSL